MESSSFPIRQRTEPAEEAACAGMPVLDLTDVLAGRNGITLRFGEAIYHLKLTRSGKLLLNK